VELRPIEVLLAGIGIFDLFAPVTLTRWPSYANFTRILWRYSLYLMCKYEHASSMSYTSRLSKVIVWDRQTCKTGRHDRSYTPRRFGGQ